MRVVILFLAGALSAAPLVALGRLSGRREARVYAAALVLAALVYVIFAARAGAWSWAGAEAAGLAVFAAVAWLGLKGGRPLLLLAFGWAAHAAWDLLLHAGAATPFVPGWYPPVCAGFDLAVAGYLAAVSREG